MTKKTNDLDFISKKFFLALIELCFVDLFQSVRNLSAFVFCFEDLWKFTSSKTSSLGVKVIYTVELAMKL